MPRATKRSKNPLDEHNVTVNGAGEIVSPDDANDELDTDTLPPVSEMDANERDTVNIAAADLLDKPDAEAKVTAYRRDPVAKNGGEYLFEISPQEWIARGKWTLLQNRYGAGWYEVRVYGRKIDVNGDERYGLIARGAKKCADPLDPPKPETPATVAGGPATDFLGAIQALGVQQAQMFDRMLTQLVLPLMLKQNVAPAPANNIAEIINAVKAVDDLRGSHSAPVAPPVDPFAMFEKFMAMRDTFGGSGDGGGGSEMMEMIKLAREFVPMLREGMTQLPANTPAQPAPALSHTPQQLPPNVTPIHQQPEMSEDDMIKFFIQRELTKLIACAKNNDPVEPHAEKLAAELPESVLNEWLDRADWLDYLATFTPEVKQYQFWFTRLRDKIDELTSDPEPDNNADNSAKLPGTGNVGTAGK